RLWRDGRRRRAVAGAGGLGAQPAVCRRRGISPAHRQDMTGARSIANALRPVFVAAAVAGVAGVVWLAWLPVSTSISTFVIEDMGYYLTAARNVVEGRGVT